MLRRRLLWWIPCKKGWTQARTGAARRGSCCCARIKPLSNAIQILDWHSGPITPIFRQILQNSHFALVVLQRVGGGSGCGVGPNCCVWEAGADVGGGPGDRAQYRPTIALLTLATMRRNLITVWAVKPVLCGTTDSTGRRGFCNIDGHDGHQEQAWVLGLLRFSVSV